MGDSDCMRRLGPGCLCLLPADFLFGNRREIGSQDSRANKCPIYCDSVSHLEIVPLPGSWM